MPVAPACGRVAEVYAAAGVAPVLVDAAGRDLHLIAGDNDHNADGGVRDGEAL